MDKPLFLCIAIATALFSISIGGCLIRGSPSAVRGSGGRRDIEREGVRGGASLFLCAACLPALCRGEEAVKQARGLAGQEEKTRVRVRVVGVCVVLRLCGGMCIVGNLEGFAWTPWVSSLVNDARHHRKKATRLSSCLTPPAFRLFPHKTKASSSWPRRRRQGAA